jgi:hypothetical protein
VTSRLSHSISGYRRACDLGVATRLPARTLIRRFKRPTIAAWLSRLFLPASRCSSLFSPFFTLLRGDSGLDSPPKTVCSQKVDQEARLSAEQELNREIIRLNREIIRPYQARTGRLQATNGSSRTGRHSAPIPPPGMGRLVARLTTNSVTPPARAASRHLFQSAQRTAEARADVVQNGALDVPRAAISLSSSVPVLPPLATASA